MSVQWFRFRSRLHARNPEKDRFTAHCGLAPADVADLRVTLADASDVPDGCCEKCLVAVALDSTIDEPLEVAQARGFLPVDQNL